MGANPKMKERIFLFLKNFLWHPEANLLLPGAVSSIYKALSFYCCSSAAFSILRGINFSESNEVQIITII